MTKSRYLVLFGVISWGLTFFASAEDLSGNYIAPTALILVSAIAMLVFVISACIHLWKSHKIPAILFLVLSLISLVYVSAAIKIINFILFMWVISLLWTIGKYEGCVKRFQKDAGLPDDEFALIQKDVRIGDHKTAVNKISKVQELYKKDFKRITGVDVKEIVPVIGKEISWADIVNHAFRVLDFDRNGTTIDDNNQVKAASQVEPYGYLLAESAILNNRIRLPIIHRDDFLLAASVYDEPKLMAKMKEEELLVVYSPKDLGAEGLSASPHHVLHYAITPRGTLDAYYSRSNNMYMARPEPEKLIGQFVYQGEIRVGVNPDPKF